MMNVYPICPVPKPRMTRADKWKQRPCVMRYRAFADQCREVIKNPDLNNTYIVFVLPMPKSWSKKKKAEQLGQPHMQKPDISNLLKALEDALYAKSGIDDSSIHTYKGLSKIWGTNGSIRIA